MQLKKLAVAVVGTFLISTSLLKADDTSANISIGKMISNLKISGDVRLRQENFWYVSNTNADRSRQRFRFRLGIEPQIQDIKIGFRLASGSGEQVSSNQSFDSAGSQKAIFIDQAYVQWKPFEWMALSGGKMPNLLWRTYASDLVWDDDLNPEGFSQQFNYGVNEYVKLFSNTSEIVLDEDSNSTFDQWAFAQQIGANVKIHKDTRFNGALSYYYFMNENKTNLGADDISAGLGKGTYQNGNSYSASNVLQSTFNVIHLTTELQTKVFGLPLSLQADYVKNLAPNGGLGEISLQQAGYQAGFILGKAAAAQSWEVAYFNKWVEANSTLAVFADSDFGNGGTNRRGHIFWLAYAPRDYLLIKAKVYSSEAINKKYSPFDEAINRMQLDFGVKF